MAEPKMSAPTYSAPNPDPTQRTQEQSEKAVAALKELIEARIKALEDFAGRLQTLIDSRPAAVITEIGHLKELMTVRFTGVEQQLSAQKILFDAQTTSNTNSATKSEAALTKQIDNIGDALGAQTKVNDEKIADIRERLNGTDGRKAGYGDSWAVIVAVIGVVGTIAATIALVLK